MTAGDIIILTGVSGLGKSTLAARAHHFFDASLLDSQMDILEMPGHDEIYRLIDASGDIDSVYGAIRKALS